MSLEQEIQDKFQTVANHDIPYGERMVLACEVTDMLKAIGLDETLAAYSMVSKLVHVEKPRRRKAA